MIVTEDEARQKWCPLQNGARCDASLCMMWVPVKVLDAADPRAETLEYFSRGCCGLTGEHKK